MVLLLFLLFQDSDDGFTPIFIVSRFLKTEDPFECSWDVTSDSIAAYVSHLLNAKLLIVTNVNGIYTQEPKELGSTFISKIDAKTLLTFQESSIDVMLPSLLLEFGTNCYVVNGKCPERVLSLIDDNINDYQDVKNAVPLVTLTNVNVVLKDHKF